MYFNPSWSHAHSAFIVALFLLYWDRTRPDRTLQQWFILGVIVGIMLDVYFPNLMILSLLGVEAFWQYRDAFASPESTFRSLRRPFVKHALFGVVVVVAMIPTFVSRWIVYGGPFESGYVSIRDYLWSSPVFWSVLFSSNHGLIAWTPIVIFAVVGLMLFAFRFPGIGTPFLASVATFYIFISFYPDWAGIASFGNRFFVSLTPLWIMGLAFLMSQMSGRFLRTKTGVAILSVALTCLVLWNLGLMYQWGTQLVPARGPISFREATYNQFRVVPFEITSRLHSYFFRRGDLMRQIEHQDENQLKDYLKP